MHDRIKYGMFNKISIILEFENRCADIRKYAASNSAIRDVADAHTYCVRRPP